MICPKCDNNSLVYDTRYEEEENEVFRCRVCKSCSHKFFTIEFEIENNDKFNSIWKKLARGSGGSRKSS